MFFNKLGPSSLAKRRQDPQGLSRNRMMLRGTAFVISIVAEAGIDSGIEVFLQSPSLVRHVQAYNIFSLLPDSATTIVKG
uniref:Uncharacterized protein n=1 Tax=mine drainage metagenome TaxID=410659 RepID=E6PTM7_9ZZZZ